MAKQLVCFSSFLLFRVMIVNNNLVDPKQMKICEDSGLDSLLNLANMPQVKVQSLATDVINSLIEEGSPI